MAQSGALTQSEVQDLVYTWFRKITDKCPEDEMLAMLSTDGLEMRFPERTLKSYDDFRDWYHGVAGLFFDQVHELKMLAVDLDGERANVTLVVNWQAHTWNPPAAYSEWSSFLIHQDWTVRRDRASGRPVIVTYLVGTADPMRTRPV